MVVAIHQPNYIPYIGLFYKIMESDVFVFLDDAQFSKGNVHERNIVKSMKGECRLKIPVEYRFGDSIMKVRTKDELNWKEKHLKTLEDNYRLSKNFDEVYDMFSGLIEKDYSNLAEMNIAIITEICKSLEISTKFVRSSQLDVAGAKEERVIAICEKLGASEYISGNGARVYQEEEHFTSRGIKLTYSRYKPFEYPQLWSNDFLPNASILDYLFNCGFTTDRFEV